jgi:hypothetical protein
MMLAPEFLTPPVVSAQGPFFRIFLTFLPQCGIDAGIFGQGSLDFLMDSKEFFHFRKVLKKTQKQMAELLGTSVKAIHSYEQGWRRVPPHAERQVFFLVSRAKSKNNPQKPCWVIKKCPPKQKEKCPAWEFRAGQLCWFVNGTICEGEVHKDWDEKMEICRGCEVLISLIDAVKEND